MEKQKTRQFKLKVASSPENLGTIREFIHDISLNAGFDSETAGQIELAVDEACTNVIKHAHKYEYDKSIDLLVLLDAQKITVTITDRGLGFDVNKVAKPDLQKYIHEAKKGGLGIHLMRSLMDEVQFEFNPGVKNQVTMVKYFKNNK